MFSNFKFIAGSALLLLALSPVCSATIIYYTFDDVAQGTAAPFYDTRNGLTASFSTTGAVCDISSLGFSLQSGNALISNFCVTQATSPIDVAFSSPLTDISMDFALTAPTTLTLTAFMGGEQVGSVSATGSDTFFPEGVLEFSGVQFDSLRLSTPNVAMSIDNMAATVGTPEPSSLLLIGAAAVPLFILKFRRRP
jgi:hypothetical protein